MIPTKFLPRDYYMVEFITDEYKHAEPRLLWHKATNVGLDQISSSRLKFPKYNEIILGAYNSWEPEDDYEKMPMDKYRIVLSAPDGTWLQDSAGDVAPKNPPTSSQST